MEPVSSPYRCLTPKCWYTACERDIYCARCLERHAREEAQIVAYLKAEDPKFDTLPKKFGVAHRRRRA